jgi:DNA primase
LLDRLSRQHDPHSDRGKLQIARQMAGWLARIPTPILLATYAQQTAKRLDISEDTLRQEVNKLTGHRNERGAPADTVETADAEADPGTSQARGLPAEEMVLRAMLADDRVIEMVEERLDVAWLSDSVAGRTIHDVLKLYKGGRWTGPGVLLDRPQNEEMGRLVSELLLSPQVTKRPEAVATDCLATLERNWLTRILSSLRRQLETPGMPVVEIVRLQQQVLDLRRKLDHIAQLSLEKR